ncbi:hypothetical protein HYU11_02395 [Candidatus Woesearchaeota archaeon]|nr:hypothetical protein [Candidatus Woesearchaeota archaeon]
MISSFLKKLLFARQFYINEGKIELLGKKQIMLPCDVVAELEKGNPKLYDSVKKAVINDMKNYAQRLGGSEEGMIKNIDHLFETFGLGTLQIVKLDYKTKKCTVIVRNSPLTETNVGIPLTSAVVAGMFSFLLEKDMNTKQSKKVSNNFEYVFE